MSKLLNHGSDWTKDQEMDVVETVIDFLWEGRTQKEAFEKLSVDMGRTFHSVQKRFKEIRWSDDGVRKRVEDAKLSFKPHLRNNYIQNPGIRIVIDVDPDKLIEIQKTISELNQAIESIDPLEKDVKGKADHVKSILDIVDMSILSTLIKR